MNSRYDKTYRCLGKGADDQVGCCWVTLMVSTRTLMCLWSPLLLVVAAAAPAAVLEKPQLAAPYTLSFLCTTALSCAFQTPIVATQDHRVLRRNYMNDPLRKSTMSGVDKMDEGDKVYGGCEGPDAMYVKLISSDGHEFIVKREHALTSGTIKAMLSGPGQFAENETNEVHFREIPSHVLQKVCMYFTYKVRYTNSSTEIPEFPIAPEIALELLMAANFLDC
ncbi:hypothetical protein B566_EDAN008729 [Ephemera danica]|nr:hypothetical protein B566_EDAN008729 [Ephemera danica]